MRVARFGFVECGGCRVLGLPILAVSEFGGYVVLGLLLLYGGLLSDNVTIAMVTETH